MKPSFGMETRESERAARRYKALCEQLYAEDVAEHGRGSQGRVGKALGVSQGFVSKVMNDEQQAVEVGLYELAVERLKIRPDFFFTKRPTNPHYRDFRVGGTLPTVMYKALGEFLHTMSSQDDAPNEAERHALETMVWDGEPTYTTYALLLQALRTVRFQAATQTRKRATG